MITVLGSINMDLVTSTDKDPDWGETVIGSQFHTNFGGKGANQAVAAAKLGAKVQMIGAVGNDAFGQDYLEHLKQYGIKTEHIQTIQNERTGVAAITLHNEENKIIVVPGANAHVTPEVVEKHKEAIQQSEWLLLQLEIPAESVNKAIEIAHATGTKVILNPAPFQPIPQTWIEKLTYLTPNESEANQLLKQYSGNKFNLQDKLIITKGEKGVTFYQNEQENHIPAPKVKAVDTTGAGDTFNGALTTALAEGTTLKEACEFASKAAAISVTKLGAQTGMPAREEL
ncbi:ribokinase [Bacillus salacetis]|uniref:ribokinase n=1 Tax=Bacillus salacetis TaxID=2315464 RepID=UPI003BA146AD